MNELGNLEAARRGNQQALLALFERVRPELRRFVYRILASPDEVNDTLQEVWIRGQQGIGAFRGNEASLRSWWFSIASRLCLDRLEQRKRWRVEAQLIGEQELDSDPDQLEALAATMSDPGFRYEVTEHISFCLTCVSRSLEPTLQSALFLREIFDFGNEEAAEILGVSEPVFRHRLASARSQMVQAYEGLCQLINKSGRCYQCTSLRGFAPEGQRSEALLSIKPSSASTEPIVAEALLSARLEIAKTTDLEDGGSSGLHRLFFQTIANREDRRST